MRILITNDDGITAPGLAVAEQIAAEIAGPDGEIWVVAPENERSGASHAISYTSGMRINQLDERRFAVDGFPADCALVGVHKILKETPPDLVISGVNRGHNVAEDVIYSGTVGAAMEGAMAGIPSIALSQFYSKDGPRDVFSSSRALGAEILGKVVKMPFTGNVFYNVNFPAVPPDEVEGTKVCAQGIRADATFDVIDYLAPNGRTFQFLKHGTRNSSAPEGSDANLCYHGWITISPLRPQMTATDILDDARALLG
ncbi:5'/3'-nucleotidase SurE [Rhodobacteraceae bacterium NNCM2]|nr:5'/3'-nucleotidase SurE [Coraliihabitans acroporae]